MHPIIGVSDSCCSSFYRASSSTHFASLATHTISHIELAIFMTICTTFSMGGDVWKMIKNGQRNGQRSDSGEWSPPAFHATCKLQKIDMGTVILYKAVQVETSSSDSSSGTTSFMVGQWVRASSRKLEASVFSLISVVKLPSVMATFSQLHASHTFDSYTDA
jgi:hypothetical protein